MNNENIEKKSLSEPATEFKTVKPTQGLGKDFDFEKRFAEGYTIEEAKAEMRRRISKWKFRPARFLQSDD